MSVSVPSEKCSLKKTKRTRSKKVDALFLRKKNVPKNVERVPKWNDLERVPVV